MATAHADFSSGIDSGFSTSFGGSGTATVTGGVCQLRTPSGTDAAFLRLDQELDLTKEWTVEIKTTPISSQASPKYGFLGFQLYNNAGNFAVYPSSAEEPRRFPWVLTLSPATNEYILSHRYGQYSEYYWNGSSWQSAGVWVSGVNANTAYKIRFESKNNGGTMQTRLSILLASNDSVVVQTAWVNTSTLYIHSPTEGVWVGTGDRYTDLATHSQDVDYFYYDEVVLPPGNPQNVTATGGVNRISLTWNDPASADHTGFTVERSVDQGSNWVQIADLGPTVHSFTDKLLSTTYMANNGTYLLGAEPVYIGLKKATRYDYRVKAYNSGGSSAGVVDLAVTNTQTPASGSTYRGKHMFVFVPSAFGYFGGPYPSTATVTAHHDWIRANITTKITLGVPTNYLYATVGEEAATLAYLKQLVQSYNYDIIIFPNVAWFPTVSPYTAGESAEITKLNNCHTKCITEFGKAPVFQHAWQWNKALFAAAVALGYRMAPGGISEQWVLDMYTCLGRPQGFYRPSKLNVNMPGDGTSANTFNIVAGWEILNRSHFAPEYESVATTQYRGMYSVGNADLPFGIDIGGRDIIDRAVTSQVFPLNKYFYLTSYWDVGWLENSAWIGTTIETGVTEAEFMARNMATWIKDYLHSGGTPIADYVTATEFIDWIEPLVPFGQSMPMNAWLSEQACSAETGTVPAAQGDKMITMTTNKYLFSMRWRTGLDGFMRPVQFVPFDVAVNEPAIPSDDWSNTTGILRTASPPFTMKFTTGGGSYTINSKVGGDLSFNLHAPSWTGSTSSKVIGTWDVYDSSDTTRLLSVRITFEEKGMKVEYINVHSSVTGATITNSAAKKPYVLSHTTFGMENIGGGLAILRGSGVR